MDEERQTGLDERDNRCMIHVHTFNTLSDVADNHQHIVMGVTGPARRVGLSHVHRIRVRTSFYVEANRGHWHWFDVMTGQAVVLPDGGHVHYFNGETTIDDRHSHDVVGVTGLGPNDFDDDEDCDDDHKCYKPKR